MTTTATRAGMLSVVFLTLGFGPTIVAQPAATPKRAMVNPNSTSWPPIAGRLPQSVPFWPPWRIRETESWERRAAWPEIPGRQARMPGPAPLAVDAGVQRSSTTQLSVTTARDGLSPLAASPNAGRVVVEVTEDDFNADATIAYRITYTSAYDPRRKPVHQVTEYDSGADGTIGHRETVSFGYDQRGNLVQQVYESDPGADGTIGYRATESSEHDQRGDLVHQVAEYDNDADGTIDRRITVSFEYDGAPRRP